MLSGQIQIKGITWIAPVILVFIVINTFLIAKGFYYLAALPLIIVIIWLAFSSLDLFFYVLIFFVPLSIPLSRIIGKHNFDLYLPSEILLTGIMLLLFLKYLRGQKIDREILRHPLTLAIFFNIVWIFITSINSTMPVVSFKFLIARIWFIAGFYLLATRIFKSRKKIRIFLWVYAIPLTFIIFYVIIKLSGYGLTNQQAAHFVVDPFFIDHTSYGAILTMLIPPLTGLFIIDHNVSTLRKFLYILLILIFTFGLILSYTRAAWLSLIIVFGIWILIKLKIKWYFVVPGFLLLIILIFSFKTELLIKLEHNKQTSSGKFIEHIQSISNVRNDVSNLERLNRWNCAIRMFREKPVFGWGPGTYMFKYAPFQKSWEKTLISTNAGTMGNAHSEYLGPLAEQGILGFLSILSIIGITLWTGFRVYFNNKNKNFKIVILSIILGLCTYYIHGIMNNFLDTDKASALFWGYSAMIVAADIYHKNS